MKRFIGKIILSDDSQADLVQRIDAMRLGQLEPWHAWLLAMVSDASQWVEYHGDGSEFDPEDDDV